MKKLRIILIIPIILILSSCANVDVSYQLTGDNVIDIAYTLVLSPSGEGISGYTEAIESYWYNMGFTTDVSADDGVYTLNGQKQIICNTKQQAAEAFSTLLTDADSLFYNVSFIYTSAFEQDEYSLEASVSLENVIRQSEVQNIPGDELTKLQNNADSGEYTLAIALPGEVVSTNADSQNGQVCTWSLEYGEVTQIAIKTRKANTENIAHYAELADTYQRDGLLITVCCAAGGMLLLAIILTLLIRRIRKTRASKVRMKKFG
ncbi:MAG: hypothetical protein PHO15_10355 [Eubacteriales bacterium]|nr:hypothetical protein [Eubacteriales bacterium]